MQRMISWALAFALMIVPMGMISGAAAAHAGPTPAASAIVDCHDSLPEPERQKGVGMTAECALACVALPEMSVRIAVPPALTPVVHPIATLHGLAKAGPESLDPPPRT